MCVCTLHFKIHFYLLGLHTSAIVSISFFVLWDLAVIDSRNQFAHLLELIFDAQIMVSFHIFGDKVVSDTGVACISCGREFFCSSQIACSAFVILR